MARPRNGTARLTLILALAVGAVAFAVVTYSWRHFGKAPGVKAVEATGTGDATAVADAGPTPPAEAPPIAEPAGPSEGASAWDLLDAIKGLESGSDPKCHSTACRFENFIYGTPLDDDARDERIALQTDLIRRLWSQASQAASAAGEPSVGLARIRPLIDQVATIATGDDGNVQVRFPEVDAVEVSEVRLRQFASIAYSLRAILSVQQDALFGDARLMSLDDQSTDTLRAAIDTVTICALQLADQDARQRNSPQVTRDIMRTAWHRLMPPNEEAPGAARAASGDVGADERDQQRRVFLGLIENKLAAYSVYNDTPPAAVQRRFWLNVPTFYAIYPLDTENRQSMDRLAEVYWSDMREFTRGLLSESERLAAESGHRLIRSADANDAVAALMPHRIDDFEDVNFFFRLDEADRVTLESYDCDSYRDTGLHWQYLKDAYRSSSAGAMVPDPFAAEIIAEAISGYGVLLLRVAGRTAEQTRQQMPVLMAQHLALAKRRIVDLAEQHNRASDPDPRSAGIVSSETPDVALPDATFFTEVTALTGVDFVHGSSRWLSRFRRRTVDQPPTFSGGGIAAEDVNNDAHPDLLLVGGTGFALFINDGRGGFSNRTAEAGIDFRRPDGTHGEARQPIIADFDNDGWQDILISYNNDDHRLHRNVDGVTFEDVTEGAGLGGRGLIGGPVTVFDFDGDGLLDVYTTCFGDYLSGALPKEDRNNTNALPNRLFRNLGSMRFEDVTEGSGTDDTGWCQGVSHTDFDRDGLQDIVVANDFGRNVLLRNMGNGRFEDVAADLQITKAYHSMNVGITDLNRDSYPDIYVSNIATMVKDNKYVFPDVNTPLKFNTQAMANMLVKEANVLYMSRGDEGRLSAYEPSTDVERGATSTGWAWDAEFLDFDNDGDDDLYVVNGTNDYHVFYHVLEATVDDRRVYYHLDHKRESNVFYVNEGGKLKNRSDRSGADFKGNSRSTAYLDWDGDGDLDIAVNNFHDPATMLRNNSEVRGNNWVKVRLTGDPDDGSNRDAIGARLVATNDAGLYLLREVQGGSGYMSMNPKQQHMGLGQAESVDLEITWPNGEVQVVESLPANRSYVFEQGVADATVVTAGDADTTR